MPDRRPHIGPETTHTYWMARLVNLVECIKDSSMVMFVSSYVAASALDEEYPDGVNPETGEAIEPMERLHLILEREQKAFEEYIAVLDNWSQDDDSLQKAGRLAGMLAEANYLSLSQIQDNDEDIVYARECAYEYAKMVKATYSMFLKTRDWANKDESE